MTAQNAAEPRYAELVQEAATCLKAHAGPIVILAHIDPDGDALGSCLGLQRALRSLGKDAQTYMQVPRYLTFLPQEGEVLPQLETWPENALAAVLDVDNTDTARVAGADITAFEGPVVNIDHHGTNRREATVSVVDPSQAAAAMMVKDVVDALGAAWSADIATPLLLGTSTDTGSFRFSNTTPQVLRTAADLVERGAALPWINDQMARNPPRYYSLLREVLDQMAFSPDGLVVSSHVDEAALKRTGSAWEDVESYVNTIRNADGTELAVMYKDYGERVKVSLRSRGLVSAQNIAVVLGGGGHVAAAGASVAAPYAETVARFEAAADAELRRVGLR
ncbi:bifunctional oligoribonuclease/PAP phosphatase NrnA [Deinococcus psychrotolerans]|uniref:Bifunctional oligoribonuclease/PAP phosphatase NrnA n=1 Tax=Deinococcus psychrotolerans TaxID=2489213 RepID=A0A3G8YCH7_9DEIO|nr:bifunctional oligoribonuclease/PAP phosphatase NrnA [Deinococcus psychrotolerans]AZI43089.1 bifunctional oligoribonuclease/PAP phosphatase NrnA [Deinococcus psychrotolerans]